MSAAHPEPSTPVVVGVGQYTYHDAPEGCPPAQDLLTIAAKKAAQDAGLATPDLTQLDTVEIVGLTVDAPGPIQKLPFPRLKNAPLTVAKALGAAPSTTHYSHMGGNTPQAFVNGVCERISQGDARFALVAGAECLGALRKLMAAGSDFAAWADPDEDAEPHARFGDQRDGCSKHEALHGLAMPANAYPLFETAIRAQKGEDIEAHQHRIGRLFSPFSKVAANNPYAWFPTERSPEEIATPSPANRFVGWPYTKYMNAVIDVNQSAAVLVCSVEKARELGVAEDKWVYLHGCSETHELWNPLDRVNYHTSPAIGVAAREALSMAGKTADDMAFFDIYSCFPCAVQIAADEIGVSHDDPRGLTLTGGLPYFGGPGNNYAMHGIAEAVQRARKERGAFGMITANGWILTKHAMGVYSTTPVLGQWSRRSPSEYQSEIDRTPHPEITETPDGEATIETYTAVYGRDGPKYGIIIGRDAENRRFVARTARGDEAISQELISHEYVGRKGFVGRSDDGRENTFRLT